jgi:hypothetical protein
MGNFRTDFLTATPSALLGAATIFNLAGRFYEFNTSKNGPAADAMALRQDWRMVGQDIYKAVAANPPAKLAAKDGKS